MTSSQYTFAIIVVCGIVTVLLRTLPFILWSGKRKIPDYILWLGKVLPYAIMMMLCVFALKEVSFDAGAIAGFGSSSGGGVSDKVYDAAWLNTLHNFMYANSGWLPPLLGVGITAGTYLWKKSTMFSIILGTACYMAMVQFI